MDHFYHIWSFLLTTLSFMNFFNGKDIPCPIKVYLYPLEDGVMPITDAIHKGDRLEQIRVLFLRRPEGVGTREIAQLLGVSQRTARRYVIELSERGRLPVYRQGRIWKLVEGGIHRAPKSAAH